jgi:hypothetical protein
MTRDAAVMPGGRLCLGSPPRFRQDAGHIRAGRLGVVA